MRTVLCVLLQVYALVVVASAVLSWFPSPRGALAAAQRIARQLTEPVLAPLRRVLPLIRAGGTGIDLAPVVLLVAIWILLTVICR